MTTNHRHYDVTGGSSTRYVVFTEWSHGMFVAKFTETRADGSVVAHFEYDRGTGLFISAGTPSVGWTYQPPAGFHMIGDYPVVPHDPAERASQSLELGIPTGEYTATSLALALESALNNKPRIYHLPWSYKCVATGMDLEIKLQYDGADERYDFQGGWSETTNSNRHVAVWRDYRHLQSSVTYPEYVMTPTYVFNSLNYSATLDDGETGTDHYTDAVM